MVARRGKCPKNHFFAFLVSFHINTTYIKLDWNSDNFLIFWCTLHTSKKAPRIQIFLPSQLFYAEQFRSQQFDTLCGRFSCKDGHIGEDLFRRTLIQVWIVVLLTGSRPPCRIQTAVCDISVLQKYLAWFTTFPKKEKAHV